MDFQYTEEQRLLADSVDRFLEREYGFDARRAIVESRDGFSAQAWQHIAEMGLTALPFAVEHGGFGGGAVDLIATMEAFGAALVVEPYVSTIAPAGRIVARAGGGAGEASGAGGAGSTDGASRADGVDGVDGVGSAGGANARRASMIASVVGGSTKLAFAHIERDARYSLSRVRTRAERRDDGWSISGEKCVVLHAPMAETLVVTARIAGEDDEVSGIGVFAIDASAGGVTMRTFRTVDNLRGADVSFDRVAVPADALLEGAGSAWPIVEEAVDFATVLACAEAVGAMRYANEATLEYLKTRRQFGVPIGAFQALQHRMVEMTIEAEQARSITWLACAKVDAAARGELDARERARYVSAARVKVADACRRVGQEAVQLHGGMGMTQEMKISHTFKRLTVLAQQFGDADHHLERFARVS